MCRFAGGLPIAKSRGAVFPAEATSNTSIVALDWVDMLAADVLNDIFEKGLQ